ncbi:MAG: hypothetical protein ABSF28_22680 [Terracidiphilus sp.]|jgi:hypothetical protein
MVDTTALKKQIEPHVQEWLRKQFGVRFRRQTVLLTGNGTAGQHQFAAVSEDGKIVASVKSLSGRTTGKNLPSAKIDSSYAEIYFLSLVQSEKRLLVLTDLEFYRLFCKQSAGMVVQGVDILHCELPLELERVKEAVRVAASAEIDDGKVTI